MSICPPNSKEDASPDDKRVHCTGISYLDVLDIYCITRHGTVLYPDLIARAQQNNDPCVE